MDLGGTPSPTLLWNGPALNVDLQIATDDEIYVGISQNTTNNTLNNNHNFIHRINNSNNLNASFQPNVLNVQAFFQRANFPVLTHGGYPQSTGFPIVHGQDISPIRAPVVATVIDNERNVYIVGSKNAGVGFYDNQNENATSYLNKYDSCGNLLYSKDTVLEYGVEPVDLIFDSSTNSLVLLGKRNTDITEIIKLELEGGLIWRTRFINLQTPSMDVNKENGNIYFSGYFPNRLDGFYTNTQTTNQISQGYYSYHFSSMDRHGRWLGWSDNIRSSELQNQLEIRYSREPNIIQAISAPYFPGFVETDSGFGYAFNAQNQLHLINLDQGTFTLSSPFVFNDPNGQQINFPSRINFDSFNDGRIIALNPFSNDVNLFDYEGNLIGIDSVPLFSGGIASYTKNVIQIEENSQAAYFTGSSNSNVYSIAKYNFLQGPEWIKNYSYYARTNYSSLGVSEGEIVASGYAEMTYNTSHEFEGFLGYNDDYYYGHSIVINRVQDLFSNPIYQRNTANSKSSIISKFSIFPNPSDGTFNLSEDVDIKIFDLSGREMKFEKNGTQINLSGQSKGIYLIVPSNSKMKPLRVILK